MEQSKAICQKVKQIHHSSCIRLRRAEIFLTACNAVRLAESEGDPCKRRLRCFRKSANEPMSQGKPSVRALRRLRACPFEWLNRGYVTNSPRGCLRSRGASCYHVPCVFAHTRTPI